MIYAAYKAKRLKIKAINFKIIEKNVTIQQQPGTWRRIDRLAAV